MWGLAAALAITAALFTAAGYVVGVRRTVGRRDLERDYLMDLRHRAERDTENLQKRCAELERELESTQRDLESTQALVGVTARAPGGRQ